MPREKNDSRTTTVPISKSEILFLYESAFSIPNGDPFTGEQRYDGETKEILVSDVRIKRFVRDYIAQTRPDDIFVLDARSKVSAEESQDRANKDNVGTPGQPPKNRTGATLRAERLGLKTDEDFTGKFDVRVFGGVLTRENSALNWTGPVQFAILNRSLNRIDLRFHQNTSVFVSSEQKSQGAIATTSVVPYALIQIHGWVNPYSAKETGMTQKDLDRMLEALWYSVNNANTRSKSNQNSLLLLHIIYSDLDQKVVGLDRAIEFKPKDLRDEQVRRSDDYTLDLTRFFEKVADKRVSEVRYYAESPRMQNMMLAAGNPEGVNKLEWFPLLGKKWSVPKPINANVGPKQRQRHRATTQPKQ